MLSQEGRSSTDTSRYAFNCILQFSRTGRGDGTRQQHHPLPVPRPHSLSVTAVDTCLEDIPALLGMLSAACLQVNCLEVTLAMNRSYLLLNMLHAMDVLTNFPALKQLHIRSLIIANAPWEVGR